jgi:hypothetical protein
MSGEIGTMAWPAPMRALVGWRSPHRTAAPRATTLAVKRAWSRAAVLPERSRPARKNFAIQFLFAFYETHA